MEVALTLIYTALFSFVVYKYRFFRAEGITAKTSVVLFNLKVLAGIALALIYTFYYTDHSTGDIHKYFRDGERIYNLLFIDPLAYFQIIFGINTDGPFLSELLDTMTGHWYKNFESPLYNDNRTIIRFNAIVRLFSFGSMGVHTVVMCFISYIGLMAMYKTFVVYLKGREKELILAFFLLPSILFWGSGVLKEGVLLFGLGLFLYSWIKILKEGLHLKILGLLAVGLLILLVSKIYVLLALAPPLLAYTWCYFTSEKMVGIKYGAIFLFGLIGALSIHFILPEFDLLQMMAHKQRDFINVAVTWEAASLYNIPILEANLWSLMKGIPLAIGNVITRPHIFEAGNMLMLAAAFENMLIISVILLCIYFHKQNADNHNFMFFCIGFVVVLFALIGLITPVLGAVVRYKIPALPFLLIIFLLIFDKEKFINRFPFLKFLN